MIEQQLRHVLDNAAQQLVYGGIPEQQAKSLVEGRREMYRADAEKQVRFSLLLEAIAQTEGFVVTDEEIQQKLGEIAQMADKPIEAISAEYQKENRLEILRERLRDEKVIDMIVQNAQVKLVDELTVPDAVEGEAAATEADLGEEAGS